jgi:hypothetical protein
VQRESREDNICKEGRIEQISASRACAYGRGDIIYAEAPRPCSRGLRAGRWFSKRVKAEVRYS